MPQDMLSTVDNNDGSEDMQYLRFSRGEGSSLVFRMRTPEVLKGKTSPFTGRPLGKEIIIGLGTRRVTEAQKMRDRLLGTIREHEERTQGKDYKYFVENALEARRQIAKEEEEGLGPDDFSTRDFFTDMVQEDEARPKSRRRMHDAERETLKQFALRAEFPLSHAVSMYLEDRAEGNVMGYSPLSGSTVRDLQTAVKHLETFEEKPVFLSRLDSSDVREFLNVFLPAQRSGRTPNGPSRQTKDKHATLLRGLWRWALEKGLLPDGHANPWDLPKSVPRSRVNRNRRGVERYFSAEQATLVMRKFPQGDRLGDIFRLALITGCRASELACFLREDVEAGTVGFTVNKGKTENAPRYIPVHEIARPFLLERMSSAEIEERVFKAWPIRESTGKASAVSQAFTRRRRQVLGNGTDGALKFHSTRHTWRTLARHADIPEADINDLGGWNGQRTSNSVYNHGRLIAQLEATQWQIVEQLRKEGYLEAF